MELAVLNTGCVVWTGNCTRQSEIASRQRSWERNGLTLVELLVAIAVVGMILALILPAIQSARHAAARMQCQSHQRQICLAVHAYESNWASLPPAYGSEGDTAFVAIMPYLDVPVKKEDFSDRIAFYNQLIKSKPKVMECPSDPVGMGTNFGFNTGTCAPRQDGPFNAGEGGNPQLRDTTDGLSQTAMLSEFLQGPGVVNVSGSLQVNRSEPRRLIFNLRPFTSDPAQIESLKLACLSLDAQVAPINNPYRGASWYSWGIGHAEYNHLYPPNHRACANADSNLYAGFPPSSSHIGGVNLMLMDGSGRFISENIDGRVWQAMGTRSGAESVSLE